jgi:hypothetical protein
MSDSILRMFNNVFYVVDLNPEPWVNCMEQGCLTLEHFFPESPLLFDMETERQIKNRRKYFQSRLKTKRRVFGLTNGKRSNWGDIQATGYIHIGGDTYSGDIIYRLRAAIPTTTLEVGETVFAALGDAVQAHCSQVKPYKACGQLQGYNDLLTGRADLLRRQNHHDPRFIEGEKLRSHLERLGLTLPLINCYPKTPHLYPAQPWELGWLNYWSAETCEYLGFPDPERDRDLLEHSYQTPCGAWLVKICLEPLDLDRPDHLALFVELYQRFPKLGLREGTVEPPPPFRYPEHTGYINEDNPEYIVERLVSLLQARGYQLVEHFPENGDGAAVVIGVIRGSPDWTIIKTLPKEFFAKPLPGSEEPLLVEFGREIHRGGFVLNVYSEFEAVLLETDGTGRMRKSGIRDFEALPEDVNFNAMEESGQPPLVEFQLLSIDIETGAGDFDDYGQIAGQLHELLAGSNADLCEDERFAVALHCKSLSDGQGVTLHFLPPPC